MRDSPKIKTIEKLAETLSSLKAQGKRVVHCHGVFDPLHIGHIRHFQQARRLGDLLVVTVTPDRFVNKGSHRPVFNEGLRAETIAALSCVDYVAVNQWPMAVEAIVALRPDFYVKGAEYQEADKDRTGGITMEEQAVKSVGGQLAFTQDITFSASRLVNRHLQVFPPEVSDFLTQFAGKYTVDQVIGYLDRARSLRVLVVGEAIIDEYQYCRAIGKSSKEPMLAVKHLSLERFAGGILAVANHVANFCEKVGMVTFLGGLNPQEEFINEHTNPAIARTFLYQRDAPTVVKRRLVEEYFFTKLLEVYEINDATIDDGDNERLCAALEEHIPQYDLVIVVDFGHGMLTNEAIQVLCSKANFLAVNAQSNAGNMGYHTISRYPRADYACIAENEIRLESRDRYGDLRKIMANVASGLECDRVVVTRGNSGCTCYNRHEGFFDVPAFAGEVVDRIGAGDAFLALTALCVAQGAPMDVVGFIGNVVGAEAVATVGHRQSIEHMRLVRHIESLLQ